MKKLTPKDLAVLTTLGLLALPFSSSALTVRTEHRSSSGGVTVSEGGAAVTGDESSSVSVQNVIQGTRGHVQVTTVKDGVTTTETRDLNDANGGVVQVITPAPEPEDNTGRTPRTDRSVVAVQSNAAVSSSGGSSGTRVSVSAKPAALPSVQKTTQTSQNAVVKKVGKSSLAMVNTASAGVSLSSPTIVSDITIGTSYSNPTAVPNMITRFLSRIFSIFVV